MNKMVKTKALKSVRENKKSIVFNFGWMKLIGWMSVILFLVDYLKKTGKWWIEVIAILFIVTSFGAAAKEVLNSNEWKEESYYSRLKRKWKK